MKELVVSILKIFTVAGFASCEQQRVTDTGQVSESQTAKVLSVAHAPQGGYFYSDRIFPFFWWGASWNCCSDSTRDYDWLDRPCSEI